MKHYIKLNFIWIVLFFFSSCEKNDPIMFDSSKSLVGFSVTSLSVSENANGTMSLYLGIPEGGEGTTVTIAVSTEGLSSPAIEGTDFTLSSKSVVLDKSGTKSITINPVDNDVFGGNKSFNLVITSNTKNYKQSAQSTALITIVDNEHPLKNWIGKYSVAASSYGDTYYGKADGSWDESWSVTTSAVDGDVTKLSILGINGSTNAIIAIVDVDAKTITINPGQDLGDAYGYGPTTLYLGTNDIGVDKESNIIGTISDDGGIHLDMMGSLINSTSNGISVWDVFDTQWTKVSAKSSLVKSAKITDKKLERIQLLK